MSQRFSMGFIYDYWLCHVSLLMPFSSFRIWVFLIVWQRVLYSINKVFFNPFTTRDVWMESLLQYGRICIWVMFPSQYIWSSIAANCSSEHHRIVAVFFLSFPHHIRRPLSWNIAKLKLLENMSVPKFQWSTPISLAQCFIYFILITRQGFLLAILPWQPS